MPWKLGDPDEATVLLQLRVPESMKAWLKAQPEEASVLVRKLIIRERRRRERLASKA